MSDILINNNVKFEESIIFLAYRLSKDSKGINKKGNVESIDNLMNYAINDLKVPFSNFILTLIFLFTINAIRIVERDEGLIEWL